MEDQPINRPPATVTEAEIATFEAVVSDFTDFKRFEDSDSERRAESKRRFIDSVDYVPHYEYPSLTFFQDDEASKDKKRNVYHAVLELEVARKAAEMIGDTTRAAELALVRSFHDLRLKRIMLVEAARKLHDARTSSEQEVARETFMELNEELFGEMNDAWYMSMLGSERHKVESFQPQNEIASDIAHDLRGLFQEMDVSAQPEGEVLTSHEITAFHEAIWGRYGDVLAVVPDTDDATRYDADECAHFMNLALEAGGLAERGWKCAVDSKKANPTTSSAAKKILLPKNTLRTASELQRLIIHEQECHARRAQNGEDTGSEVLKQGTADYADIEEGLGVFLECAVAGTMDNPSFDRARERYIAAGLALGRDGEGPRDARQTFEILWRIIAIHSNSEGHVTEEAVESAKNKAYSHIENAYRGTDFWMQGIIYTKLKVYWEGFVENAHYFKDRLNDIDGALNRALVGKYDHTNDEEHGLVMTITN